MAHEWLDNEHRDNHLTSKAPQVAIRNVEYDILSDMNPSMKIFLLYGKNIP